MNHTIQQFSFRNLSNSHQFQPDYRPSDRRAWWDISRLCRAPQGYMMQHYPSKSQEISLHALDYPMRKADWFNAYDNLPRLHIVAMSEAMRRDVENPEDCHLISDIPGNTWAAYIIRRDPNVGFQVTERANVIQIGNGLCWIQGNNNVWHVFRMTN